MGSYHENKPLAGPYAIAYLLYNEIIDIEGNRPKDREEALKLYRECISAVASAGKL
ncbi:MULTISPECIES: hypothetical protein [Thalassospira]|uniref:hypothetical protein n=1 Tax=Thalassospira TaxID=168934 RepID=UPI001587C151|nr:MULTISPECIES: hypothetical protein [Thalassospira]MDM7975435.1 hypothetical protein [Thalassospira xiamenensis]